MSELDHLKYDAHGKGGKSKTIPVRSNPMKRYQVTSELLVQLNDDGQEMPTTLPDGTPLLTKGQKMAQDFDNAGKPMKGARDD